MNCKQCGGLLPESIVPFCPFCGTGQSFTQPSYPPSPFASQREKKYMPTWAIALIAFGIMVMLGICCVVADLAISDLRLQGDGDYAVLQYAEEEEDDAAQQQGAPQSPAPVEFPAEEPADLWEGELPKVKIEFEGFGDVIVELNRDAAPITVDNFLNLVNDGFYDGLGFHRIINGFMIQGGDPLGTGMGGSGESIKGEFASNGIENPIRHRRGVISMARENDVPNSASSQFFIMHQDGFFLDGDQAAFGRVIEGMDVIDEIATTTPVTDDDGSVESENRPVMTRVSVID